MFAIIQLLVTLSLCTTNIIATCNNEKAVPALNRTDGTPAGILRLLQEGEKLLELDQNDRDIVVFMGITGAGKSTFVLHMTGNDEDLTAQETAFRSRKYLIVDRCNRSSSAAKTIESFTLIPDRFIDSQTTVTYHDMPGFGDTRPHVAYDIAATYFTKKVLDHAERVKLVFVVNHSHLEAGEDRESFTELVQHVTTFIRDLSKFQDSIALIASKVSSIRNPEAPNDDPYVSDHEVAEGIAEFLEGARSIYLKDGQMKAVQLMDIFLRRKNQLLERIGVFRRPDKPGPLINIMTLQRSKRNTRTVIDTNIRFADKKESDFGYTVSQKSKNILHKLREEVLKNATESIRVLGDRIQEHFRSREYSATDLHEITSVFNQSYIEVSAFMTITEFADFMDKYVQRVGLTSTKAEDIERLRTEEKFIKFLNGISGDAAIDWSQAIQNGMGETVQYLYHSQSWYVLFLNNMYNVLHGFEVQRARSKIEIHTLSLLIRIKELEELPEINVGDLDEAMMQFLKVVGDEPLTQSYRLLGPIYLNIQKLQLLKKILYATLIYEVETTCNRDHDPELTIRGRYVVLSQAVDKLDSCPGLRYIKIFALERIFLDTNVNLMGREVNLLIIASDWVTIGQVEINLNGKSGESYETGAARGIRCAVPNLRNGKHGKPGVPGGSAGHFYGMGRNFVNDPHLTISAVGGNGGDGQKGGDGSAGKTHKRPWPVEPPHSKWETDPHADYPGYTTKRYLKKTLSGVLSGEEYHLRISTKENVYDIEIMNPPPSAGGNGGNGGKGGIGGYRGNVTLVNFCTGRTPSAKTVSQDGKSGTAGKAGKGGPGGEQGEILVESQPERWFWWNDVKADVRFDDWDVSYVIKARDGSDGASGANDYGLEYPTFVTTRDPDNDIIDFKAYACNNLPYDVRKSIRTTLRCFLKDSEAESIQCNSSGQPMHHMTSQYLILLIFFIDIMYWYL